MTDTIIPDLEKSTITIKPESIHADGKTEAVIKIQLKKSNGHNIKEDVGGVAIVCGENVIGKLGDINFNPDGYYTATISSEVIGEETFGFTLNEVKSEATAMISYTEVKEKSKTTRMVNPNSEAEPKEADVHNDMVKYWEQEGWKVK